MSRRDRKSESEEAKKERARVLRAFKVSRDVELYS